MPKIDVSYLSIIKKLYYQKKMSMNAIALELGVSIDAVCYFMRKNKLQRRTVKENEAIKFEKKALSYKLQKNLSRSDERLKLAGVMLYWAEGYKTHKSAGIDLANSDPQMIEVFIDFLRGICGVSSNRLRVLLYCYSNQNIDELVDFWSELTRIPKSQFTKPYVRKDFRVEKYGKMQYGMVHIRYSDKKLLSQLMSWIREFQREYCVGTQVVNEGGL